MAKTKDKLLKLAIDEKQNDEISRLACLFIAALVNKANDGTIYNLNLQLMNYYASIFSFLSQRICRRVKIDIRKEYINKRRRKKSNSKCKSMDMGDKSSRSTWTQTIRLLYSKS